MRGELVPMLRLALPVIAAEMGWMAMGIVDTLMVGPLGPAAIGAVGTGSILYFAVIVVGFGILYALDTFVSQAFGAGRVADCHRWLFAGFQLAGLLTIVLSVISLALVAALPAFSLHPDILALIQPYMLHLSWSTPALLVYAVCRRYLQAMHVVSHVMWGLLVANLVNAGLNWVLIYGNLGAPALGVVGSAYATVFSRVALAAFLWWVIVSRERRRPSGLHDVPFVWDSDRIRRIVWLGLPVAAQLLVEVGVFAAAAALAARIAPAAIAAHQIVLNIVGFIFMIPLGLSSAAAVRVGHAIGRGDADAARAAGWLALTLAAGVMTMSALMLVTVPEVLVRLFTTDPVVIKVGMGLLLVAAVFQLFDGVQAVSTGALRGLGNTRTPMIVNVIGHWILGLPLGYVLAFRYGWGAQGLWTGLAFGLIVTGAILLGVWHKQSRTTVVVPSPS